MIIGVHVKNAQKNGKQNTTKKDSKRNTMIPTVAMAMAMAMAMAILMHDHVFICPICKQDVQQAILVNVPPPRSSNELYFAML